MPNTCCICRKPLTAYQIKRRYQSCGDKCRRENVSRKLVAMRGTGQRPTEATQ